jgi:hypothetical protein
MEKITPPVDISTLGLLSPDAQRNVALTLDYSDIVNLCRTNTQLRQSICMNPYFWRNKLRRDFPYYDVTKVNIETEPNKLIAVYEFLWKREKYIAEYQKIINEMEADPKVISSSTELLQLAKYVYGYSQPDPKILLATLREDLSRNIRLGRISHFERTYQKLQNAEKPYIERLNAVMAKNNELVTNYGRLLN